MADFNAFPASAIGFPGQADYLLATVINQLDFYFSVDNLLGDIYLRKNMDTQGWVLLDVVAGFKKLAKLTTDRDLLKAASLSSEIVEIKVGEDGQERLRKASGWDQFVLPMDQRFNAAMNEGPQHVEPISRMPSFPLYQAQPMPTQSHPGSPFTNMSPMGGDLRSADVMYAPMSMMSPQAMFVPESAAHTNGDMNGEMSHGRHANSSHQTNGSPEKSVASNTDAEVDPDTFPGQQIEQLTVCVRMSKERLPYHNSASRTFSDGSIDASIVSQRAEKETENKYVCCAKFLNEMLTSCRDGKAATTEQTNGGHEEAAEQSSAQDVSVFWIKDNDNPVGLLPSDLTPEPYLQLRHKALEQRKRATKGTCPYDLDVLYQFWSHFLIRNFNNSMYLEFKRYAEEDAKDRQSQTGLQNLLKYYDQALHSHNTVPIQVAKDYGILAQRQQGKQDGQAYKTLHRSWRDGALDLRNRKRMSDVLEVEFRKVLEA